LCRTRRQAPAFRIRLGVFTVKVLNFQFGEVYNLERVEL
jgi:hypothetical protein